MKLWFVSRCALADGRRAVVLKGDWDKVDCFSKEFKELLDEVEHDIMNYQN